MVSIKIKKIYASYSWRWNIEDEMCGICQSGFDQMCTDCKHPTECPPCIGTCLHAYHQHCLQNWLENSKVCPMCRLDWEYKKKYVFTPSINKN